MFDVDDTGVGAERSDKGVKSWGSAPSHFADRMTGSLGCVGRDGSCSHRMDARVIFELVVAEPIDGVVVISIIGELDMASAPRLRTELVGIVAAEATPLVVLDLAGVDLLDPTGLGVIFDGVKRSRLGGGDLALARAEPQVQQDLDLMRVSEILPLYESVDDAIQALQVGRP